MTENTSLKIAIIGVDGSGKSSCFRDVLDKLTKRKIAAIGDDVLISENGTLIKPEINYLKIKSFLSKIAKQARGKTIYKLEKFGELVLRVKIQAAIENKYRPEIVLTDGSPLINLLGWGGLYYPDFYSREQGRTVLKYLTGTKIPIGQQVFYFKKLREVLLANRLGIKFPIPDMVFFLKVAPREALKRIQTRGQKEQQHVTSKFLASLQSAYELVCGILPKDTKIFKINTDNKKLPEVISTIVEKINENN
jgi:thymidylate kinase